MSGSAEFMREIAKLPRHRTSPLLDRFAELLAEEVPPRDAAERLGRPRLNGDQMLARLRKAMGPQAR